MPEPRWYPPGLPRTDPLVRLYDIVYGLQSQVSPSTPGNNSNVTNISIVGGGGGGGGSASEVQIGTHSARFGSNATLYVESDRSNAVYGNNGGGWSLVEAFWSGSFESRYGGLGASDAGAFWIETARNNVNATPPYLVFKWDGSNWAYQEGQVSRNQNALGTLFGTLGAADAGMIINVSDFRHQLQWQSNNTTTWGPNDDGRAGEGPIFREVDPSPATGWKLYDGNNVTYLLATGNTASVTLPDLTSNNAVAAYLKGGSPNGGPNAAVAPTFTGNAVTPAGAVTATFTGNAVTPSGTIAATFVGDPSVTGNTSNVTTFTQGAGVNVTVAAQSHNHAFTPTGNVSATFTGNSLTPDGTIAANFTGNSLTPSGTISADGEPRNVVRRPWFRQ